MAKQSRKKSKSSRPQARDGQSERHAAAVDPDIKAGNLRRLKRIEGQIRGLQEMVENDRYCVDILIQIAASQEGLRAVGRELLRNHMQHCMQDAIRQGPDQATAAIDELIDILHRHGR